MFHLVINKEGVLKILSPNERFKIIDNNLIEVVDDSYNVILKSYNRFYLEKTKQKLLSQVKIPLNLDMEQQLAQEEATESNDGIINIDPLLSSPEKEKQFEEICLENDNEAEECFSNSDNDDPLIFSDEDYMSDESELDAESSVDSDEELGYESSDSLMEQLRHDKSPGLPDLSAVSPATSAQGFASSSILQNSSQSVSASLADNVLEDSDYIPESVSNISAEKSSENTNNNNNEAVRKPKIDVVMVRKMIDDNIEKYIEEAEQPEYEGLTIHPVERKDVQTPRKRKLHQCLYCGKDQTHLKRHLLRKHQNESAVQLMKNATANSIGSRQPMKELQFSGDVKHNSDKAKLSTGEFRVARRPKLAGKKVSDYAVCVRCKAVILEIEYRKHVTVCAGISGEGTRNMKQLGHKFINNCHPRASIKMRRLILSRMRNDKVLRAIKYDPLLVEFGNEICEHLRGDQHKANICSKLRRLGRLKLAMKEKNFADIFVSGKSLRLVKVIETMASDPDNVDSEFLKYPTLAENVATLVKQVAKTHSVLCLRNDAEEIRTSTLKFLECFENDYRTRLSRMVSESHGKYKRDKVVELPSAEDINKLYAHLSEVRKPHYNILESEFNQASYLELLKSTLTSLQVFNSRRPGDVERIFISEYRNRQQIPKEQGVDCSSLPEEMKDLANEFALLHSRGKWRNDIKILLPPDIQLCINKLLDLRPKMDISPKNTYLFALPRTPLAEIRHPSAYVLLSRYAEKCGAKNPKALRSTGFRKNLATKCIELNLTDAELTDLAAYMGHHIDIHKSHYRRNIVSRDIPLFLKFVSKALESKMSANESDSESDEPEKNDSVVDSPYNSVTEKNTDDAVADKSDNITSNAPLDDKSLQNDKAVSTHTKAVIKKSKTNKKNFENISPKQVNTISRPRWTKTEIRIIYTVFKDFFSKKTDATPADKIKKMMDEHPNHFTGRNIKSIRTWMHIRRKKN